jgi:3-hydroxyacyl-CoA dehydrogenase
MPDTNIKRVAVVGTGVIGASWAAYFLAQGLKVSATDPAPGACERLTEAVCDIGRRSLKVGFRKARRSTT